MEAVVCAVARERGGFVLESTAADHRNGRYTVVGIDPVETVETHDAADGAWCATFAGRMARWDAAGDGLQELPIFQDNRIPFVGGWVGYVSYEAGTVLERVRCSKPRHDGLPLVRFALYDTAAVYDHRNRTWQVMAMDLAPRDRPTAGARLDRMERLLADAPAPNPIDWSRAIADEPRAILRRDDYLRRVDRAKAYIAAGEVYQVNLTQQFVCRSSATALDIYRRMRVMNPAPLSALLCYPEGAVISASPELFLELRGRQVVTRPIKGTRPRIGERDVDAMQRDALLASEKDRAELNMIVDLMRNDLGRVSEMGTVRVASAGDLEVHPTVYHRVATVTGRLREGLTCWDLLRATLPGGSVTGCPKIRAMEIIEELEVSRRGVYCGAVGYIGVNGDMMLNLPIRTAVLAAGELHLFSGGGIVADSDAEDEYAETLAKIAGLTRSVHATQARPSPPPGDEGRTA